MNMDDQLRDDILKISPQQMEKLAAVCNRFPVVEVDYTTDKKVYSIGDQIVFDVTIKRAEDDEESLAVFN